MKGITFLSGLISSFLLASEMILPAMAQITSDNTTNTTVTPSGNNFNILNGIQKGNNLFHSFKEFSIPTGGSATFNNSTDVVNIINRVTGGNISNIDGLIKANGNANLFLINPAGIVFGENASLNIGGSFLGSTAESILFEDGFNYSAIDSQATPLLTVSVPLGLQMGTNPGVIEVQGNGHQLQSAGRSLSPINRSANTTGGLRVQSGQTLALIGGDITLQGGMLIADGGRVELGSVQNSSTVNLTTTLPGFVFNYPDITSLGNIQLSQKALVDVSGSGSGSIQVQGRQVSLTDSSLLIAQNSSAQINVRATDSLLVDGYSTDQGIQSGLLTEALDSGASQDITINTRQLTLRNGGGILAHNFGSGNGGNIAIEASEFVQVRDRHPANIFSSISSNAYASGIGGNVTISTPQLTVAKGGNIASATLSRTQGNGGDLRIDADHIEVIGDNIGGTALSSVSFGSGDAGNIVLNTRTLMVRDSGLITSSSLSRGKAGNITINGSEAVTVEGFLPDAPSSSKIRSAVLFPSQAQQRVFGIPAIPIAQGGSITINTPSLTLRDQGAISVKNEGIGDAGTIQFNGDSIRLTNNGSISAITNSGEGGNIYLNLQSALILRSNTFIDTESVGTGNGGNITINSPVIAGFENSDIIANAVEGNGGNIDITTQAIFGLEFRDELTEENDITASSQFGVNGTVEINNLSIDPSSRLVELPVQLTDSSQKIAEVCSSNTGSSFVVTGRGGIPQNPNERVSLNPTWSDIRDLSAFSQNNNKVENTQISKQISNKPAIVEATGFIRNSNGEIELVALSPKPLTTKQISECSGSNT